MITSPTKKKKEKERYGGVFSLEHELMNHPLGRQYFLVKKEFHTSHVGLQIWSLGNLSLTSPPPSFTYSHTGGNKSS